MRRMRIVMMAALLATAMGLSTLYISAQDEPPGEPKEKTYVTPPAWKSVEIGNFYLRRKKYRAALSRFKEALRTDPYNAEAHLGMGKIYDRLGLGQLALENYRKYLDLLPSAEQAEKAGDVHKAITRLEKDLKRSGPSASAQTKADHANASTR